MSKGNIVKILLLASIVVLGSFSVYLLQKDNIKKPVTITADEKKFKEEYESLNDKNNVNGKPYIKINVAKKNYMEYLSIKDAIAKIKSGTGVIYFGFPECPWCRNAIPVLVDAAADAELETIYYCNALADRDQKHVDENGNIVVDKEGTKEYYELLTLLNGHLGGYEGLPDSSLSRLYFPTVVFVKDGVVIDVHIDTLESQTDATIPLTEEQHNQLKKIYMDGMNKVLSSSCDEKC